MFTPENWDQYQVVARVAADLAVRIESIQAALRPPAEPSPDAGKYDWEEYISKTAETYAIREGLREAIFETKSYLEDVRRNMRQELFPMPAGQ